MCACESACRRPTTTSGSPRLKSPFYPTLGHQGPEGSRGTSLLFFKPRRQVGVVKATPSAALAQGNRPGTHCTGAWMDHRFGLDGCENLSPTGIRPRNVQPVAIRYNDYAIPTKSAALNVITLDYKLVECYCVQIDRTGCSSLTISVLCM
jgi:hypothetical protein